MEIRNNNTQSFGMALRKPNDVQKFLKSVNEFNINDKELVRGVKQVARDLKHHKNYDVKYDDVLDTFDVVEKSTDEVVKSFSKNDSFPESSFKELADSLNATLDKEKRTARDVWEATKQLAGLARIKVVSPKEYLSRAFLAAANEADKLDKTSRIFE